MDKFRKQQIWLIICSMATFFTLAASGPKNNILIVVMVLLAIPYLLSFRIAKAWEALLYLLLALITFTAVIRHPETLRISTLLYSALFVMTYVQYMRIATTKSFNPIMYVKILKFLMIAFLATLLIQQALYIAGLPIFNYRVGDLSNLKFNSLASEPAYAAKITFLLMLSFLSVREIELGRTYNIATDFKNDKYWWLIFLYQMIGTGSSFAIVAILLLLLKFSNRKSILIVITCIFILFQIANHFEIVRVQRLILLSKAVATLDINKMFEADISGAFRVAPTIKYLTSFEFNNSDFWFGGGIDCAQNNLRSIHDAVNQDEGFYVGLFPFFPWDYGLIATLLLFGIVFYFSISSKVDILIWLMVSSDAPFNTQLFWVTLILMSTNKLTKHLTVPDRC